MRALIRLGPLLTLLAAGVLFVAVVPSNEPPQPETAAAIKQLLAGPEPVRLAGAKVDAPALRTLYGERGFAPMWTREGQAAVADTLGAALTEGLDPADYHVQALASRIAASDARTRAELDILLTDRLLRYGSDIQGGRLRPPDQAVDAAQTVRAAAGTTDPRAVLAALVPEHPAHRGLREALARYRGIAAAGGWPAVPEGPTLHPGADDPAVPALRARLAVTGELSAGASESTLYDEALVAAVRVFQEAHGLTPDGVVGPGTRAALNVPVERRVLQIIVNLERTRRPPAARGRRHVTVNIPAYSLQLVEDGQPVLEMPVVVGRRAFPTPVFRSRITDVIFNPRWTVPRAIARDDLLPKIRRDPDFLVKNGIQVYASWQPGAPALDPLEVDWATVGQDLDALRLAQEPGPLNALGHIKLNMPNPFGVYMHDTPSHRLFRTSMRAFSSGCIRLAQPLELVARLMDDMTAWPEERRQEAIASGQNQAVGLKSPVPVDVIYQTAWADESGAVQFRADVYGHDTEMAQALAGRRRPAAVHRTPPPGCGTPDTCANGGAHVGP